MWNSKKKSFRGIAQVALIQAFMLCAVPGSGATAPLNTGGLHAYALGAALHFDPTKRIYTSDGVAHATGDLPSLLDRAFAGGSAVVFFVHGRGNEPKKSLSGGTFVEGDAVHKLEEQYGVRVLMFNWNSKAWGEDRTRPLSQMEESGRALGDALDEISKYRSKKNADKPFVFLAHSMGSIVLQTLINSRNGWVSTTPLFTDVLLTEPDADNVGHASWVDKIASVEHVFVTINKDDIALNHSQDDRPPGIRPLGIDPGNELSGKTTYLVFTDLSDTAGNPTKQHELFNKHGLHGQVQACLLFQSLLRGGVTDVAAHVEESSSAGGQLLHVKFQRDANNSCFASPGH